ncbi:MAG TPA: acyl-CoA dehydrogenase family protein, partial [Dehalococcoidia bacterium]|nr:acyl-CoA dehydrogenase family protein [Dehalococcoidia bacterium]
MDFELSEEQKMFQSMLKDFVDNEIVPHAAEWDETNEFPINTLKKMAGLGLFGLHLPEEYGGSGDDLTFVLACEQLARGSGGLSSIYITTVSLAIAPIVMFGNDEQRSKYIPRV